MKLSKHGEGLLKKGAREKTVVKGGTVVIECGRAVSVHVHAWMCVCIGVTVFVFTFAYVVGTGCNKRHVPPLYANLLSQVIYGSPSLNTQ